MGSRLRNPSKGYNTEEQRTMSAEKVSQISLIAKYMK